MQKGLVSEEKLLKEGFISEKVQELSSDKQGRIPDDGLKLTISHNQKKYLPRRTDEDLAQTKTDVKPAKNWNTKNVKPATNWNTKNVKFDSTDMKQFSVKTRKDYLSEYSRITFKKDKNLDKNHDFAGYIQKMFQGRKGNS